MSRTMQSETVTDIVGRRALLNQDQVVDYIENHRSP